MSLIIAIGAQNAYILKQGLKQQHVFVLCAICSLSDAILITAGILGFDIIVQKIPLIEQITRYVGAAFLFVYAATNFKLAFATNSTIKIEDKQESSMLTSVLTCLAFTWLNPHVYLDTVIILGSISTQHIDQQLAFNIGAVTASFFFFFSLGYGAKYLAPFFKSPKSWQVLECITGLIMLFLGIRLLI